MILRWSFIIWPRQVLDTLKSNRTETCPEKKDFPQITGYVRPPSGPQCLLCLPMLPLSLSPQQGMLLRPLDPTQPCSPW